MDFLVVELLLYSLLLADSSTLGKVPPKVVRSHSMGIKFHIGEAALQGFFSEDFICMFVYATTLFPDNDLRLT